MPNLTYRNDYDNDKLDCIVMDIDGCLANCMHRYHFAAKGDYDMFYNKEEMAKDIPIPHMFELIGRFAYGKYEETQKISDIKHIVFSTGRSEFTREWTLDFLMKHWTCHYYPTCEPRIFRKDMNKNLFMRKNKDWRPAHLIKQAHLDEEILPMYNVLWAMEDHPETVDMFTRNGILCLQPNTRTDVAEETERKIQDECRQF